MPELFFFSTASQIHNHVGLHDMKPSRLRFFIKQVLLSGVALCIMLQVASGQSVHGVAPEADCSPENPIIFIHGAMASGDTYAPQVRRFVASGYCPDRLLVYDWNTTTSNSGEVQRLDALIDDLQKRFNTDKVNLVGHSAGGRLSYGYLSDAGRAEKVGRYVHIGSFKESKPAGPAGAEVPTLNIYSADDRIVAGGDIPGATNTPIPGLDHYQVATSKQTFEAMYSFLLGKPVPMEATKSHAPNDGSIILAGRAVTFGENQPVKNAVVEVYLLDCDTGFRRHAKPDATLSPDSEGKWGPIQAAEGVCYEFCLRSVNNEFRPVRYFHRPFEQSENLVYLRAFPAPGSMAGMLLSSLPKDDAQTVLAIFSSDQAVVNGRDVLTVNGVELSTPLLASARQTTIAFFMYDSNNNGQSDHSPIPVYNMAPFLKGLDCFFPADASTTIHLEMNGKKLNVPSSKSESEGVVIAVF